MIFNILLIGNDNSGKTTFLRRFMTGEYNNNPISTVNVNTMNGIVTYNIIETDNFANVTTICDAVIILCDNVMEIVKYRTYINNNDYASKPCLYVLSKCDISTVYTENFLKISSRYNSNLKLIFDLLTFNLTNKQTIPHEPVIVPTIK